MIDSHCHIAGEEFVADLPTWSSPGAGGGVSRALVILAAEDDAEIAGRTVLAAWPECRFAVGVHPHQAKVSADPKPRPRWLGERLDACRRACAVGEIGLDYHYDFSPRDVQQAVFRAQLRLARDRELPVVIHTREAEDDTLRILREEGRRGCAACSTAFTGDAAAAARALATGFLTLDSRHRDVSQGRSELREAAAGGPADRLLVETDSPYLAPTPFAASATSRPTSRGWSTRRRGAEAGPPIARAGRARVANFAAVPAVDRKAQPCKDYGCAR